MSLSPQKQEIKVNKIMHIDHVTPRKFQYVNKQQGNSVKTVPVTTF